MTRSKLKVFADNGLKEGHIAEFVPYREENNVERRENDGSISLLSEVIKTRDCLGKG